MNVWLAVNILFELSVFIVGIVHRKRVRESGLKSLPYFLLFVFVGELTGFLLAKHYHTNVVYYNIFTPIQTIYYLFLVQHNLESQKAKKTLLFSVVFFVIAALANCCFLQDINVELVSYTFTLGALLITFWVSYFFYELLQSNKIERYHTYPFFWVGIGLFIFYVCNIPYMSVYNYLANNYMKIFRAYFIIIEILNYFMYSFFIIGLLCTKKK